MPDINLSIPHNLSQDEALHRVQSAIADARAQYAKNMQDLQENWNGYAGTLNVTAMGQDLQIALTVNPSDINIRCGLPFIASMFRGQIESTLREQVGKLLT